MDRNYLVKRISELNTRKNILRTNYGTIINKLRDLESNINITFNSLIPDEKKLFKLQKKIIEQEVFYESAKLALNELLLNIKSKQTNLFGAFNGNKKAINFLIGIETELLDDIHEYDKDIKKFTIEFNEKTILKEKIFKLLKFKDEYFTDDYIIASQILEYEVYDSENRLNDLNKEVSQIIKQIQTISNTYSIKISPSFLGKIYKKKQIIQKYIAPKIQQVKVTNENLKIIKQKVNQLKADTNWNTDIISFLPAFSKDGITKQDPNLWNKEHWDLYNTFILYMYARGYLTDEELIYQDNYKLYHFINYVSSLLQVWNPKLNRSITSDKGLYINDIYNTFNNNNVIKRYLEKE